MLFFFYFELCYCNNRWTYVNLIHMISSFFFGNVPCLLLCVRVTCVLKFEKKNHLNASNLTWSKKAIIFTNSTTDQKDADFRIINICACVCCCCKSMLPCVCVYVRVCMSAVFISYTNRKMRENMLSSKHLYENNMSYIVLLYHWNTILLHSI